MSKYNLNLLTVDPLKNLTLNEILIDEMRRAIILLETNKDETGATEDE